MNDLLQQKLARLPDRPGCYLFKDDAGQVLYVGKAEVLRNRVRSYFQESAAHTARITTSACGMTSSIRTSASP